MAGEQVVHIGENSPEQVAYRLFHHIVDVEDKKLHASRDQASKVADRKWILETFAQCMNAVRNPGYHL